MTKIEQIQEMINASLPEKDKKIAINLLDKRKFVELKELVDSDVFKEAQKKIKLFPLSDDDGNLLEEPSPEYAEAEERYNKLKDLQDEVNLQAQAFESDLDDEEYFIPEDYD